MQKLSKEEREREITSRRRATTSYPYDHSFSTMAIYIEGRDSGYPKLVYDYNLILVPEINFVEGGFEQICSTAEPLCIIHYSG